MTGLLLLMVSELVAVVPGAAVYRLSGAEASAPLLVRNLGLLELTGLVVEARAEGCEVEVSPDRLPVLRPSDRTEFMLRVRRTPGTPPRRVPLEVRLTADGQPELSAFRLVVDARPGLPDEGRGWVDVGVVRIGPGRSSTRAWWMAGLSLVGLGALLGVGLWLKRRSGTR
jgi:hypothetical protein